MADPVIIATWVLIAVVVILAIAATHRFEHTRGRKLLNHGVFIAVVLVIAFLFPAKSQNILFSVSGVVIFGAVIPIYESIRAVCTPQTDDDTSWLQYWCAMAAVFFIGSYLDDYALAGDKVQFHFHQFEVFFFVWLWTPFTDGSTLIFDFITRPFLTPVIKPISEKMGGWLTAITMTVINASHLWVLWVFFVFLPASLKRFVVTATGVAYPLLASVVAVTTEQSDDDTFWLTYWSCYGTLFVLVDWLETWLGKIPGFYTGILFCTVYLMLPMFNGAEKLFRHVLVPIAGLKEMLLLRDAIQVKKDMMKSLPPERQSEVSKAIATFFSEEGEKTVRAKDIPSTWWTGSNRGYGSVNQDTNV